jgi:hypothetical protein
VSKASNNASSNVPSVRTSPAGHQPLGDRSDARRTRRVRARVGGQESESKFQVAVSFLFKALGVEGYSDLPMQHLMTAESLGHWGLPEVAEQLKGFGVGTHTRYVSPSWALILVSRAERLRVVDEPELVEAWGVFVRYEDGLKDWRVHALAGPNDPGRVSSVADTALLRLSRALATLALSRV